MGLGLAEPGARAACWVEWDEYAQSDIIAGQRAGYFHPAPIWDDVTTFDGAPWRGRIDTITAGYPCFVAGTIVCARRGHIPIETVRAGDQVLTHRGRWRRVTATMRKSDAPVCKIKAQGVPGAVCTGEHPFYVAEGQWRAAAEIAAGDRVAQVLPDARGFDYRSPQFWWVIGRYLADGWRQWSPSQRNRRRGRITICCAKHEANEVAERIEQAGLRAYGSEERATCRFAISNHNLYEFTAQFGSGAAGKHLPGWVLELDAKSARALCEGYFSGDGYRFKNSRGSGGGWRVTTVSKALALSFAALAQRAFGVVASVRRQAVPSSTVIEGRTVNQRDQYILVVPDRNRSGRVDGRYGWKRVRSNEPCGRADVYNIAVDEDESYVADGAVVHNCQPFSAAGQRRGADDERHLWPDIARIVQEVRPRWVFFENVGGHVSLGLEAVLRDLWGMGFTPASGLFTASEVGATHKRERVFIVGRSLENCEFAGAGGQGGSSGERGRDAVDGRRARLRRGDGAGANGRGDGALDNAPSTRHDGAGEGQPTEPESRERLSGDGRDELADADGGRADSGQQRLFSSARRDGRADHGVVADTGDGQFPIEGRRPQGRDGAGSAGASHVGLAAGERLEGREQPGPHRDRDWSRAHGPVAKPGCARIPLAPPGPRDLGGWADVLRVAPDLAPALSVGDIKRTADHLAQMVAAGRMAEAEAESVVRGMADGLAGRTRALRLLGNGVHPLAAAYAWRSLSHALGLRPVDLEAAGRDE